MKSQIASGEATPGGTPKCLPAFANECATSHERERHSVGGGVGSEATYGHNCFAVLNFLVSCFRTKVPFCAYESSSKRNPLLQYVRCRRIQYLPFPARFVSFLVHPDIHQAICLSELPGDMGL